MTIIKRAPCNKEVGDFMNTLPEVRSAGLLDDLPAELRPLVQDVESFVAQSVSKNTLRAYSSDWRTFAEWCELHHQSALPASSATVALYAAHLVRLGRKAATIDRHMSSIKHFHRWMKYSESPTDTVEVETVLRGIRRTIGTDQQGKAPATTPTLRTLVEACPDTLIGLRDRALLLIGFAGAFRRSPLVALDVSDIAFRHEGLVIHIRKDKTDQEQQGRDIGIPYGSNPTTCPVRALRAWLDVAAITEGAVFRSFDKRKNLQTGRIAPDDVARIIKRRCKDAGIDPTTYAGHSLRAGFVTSAAEAGVQERVIAEQTGHESMRVLRRYIRKGSLFRDNPAAKVGL